MSWMMSLKDAKYSTSQCEYINYGGFQIFDKYSCQILTNMATKFPHLWLPNLSQKKDKITFFHQTKKPHYKNSDKFRTMSDIKEVILVYSSYFLICLPSNISECFEDQRLLSLVNWGHKILVKYNLRCYDPPLPQSHFWARGGLPTFAYSVCCSYMTRHYQFAAGWNHCCMFLHVRKPSSFCFSGTL